MNCFICSGKIGEYGFEPVPANGKVPSHHKFTISVATDKKRTGQGATGYEYIYIKCTVWGDQKVNLLANSFKPGDVIEVSGNLSVNEYTDRNNNPHRDLQISSANISFVPRGGAAGTGASNNVPTFDSNNTPTFDSNTSTQNNHGITGNTNFVSPDNFSNSVNVSSDSLPSFMLDEPF